MMEFLGEIKTNVKEDLNSHPSSTSSSSSIATNKTEIEFSAMINILIMHAQSYHVTLQVFLPFYSTFILKTSKKTNWVEILLIACL